MSAHTPGPWVVLTNGAGYPYQIHAPNGDDHRAGVVGSMVTRWGTFTLPSSKEAAANARLIAAAPELLAALIEADEDLAREGFSRESPYRVPIRAAIAKATGATP